MHRSNFHIHALDGQLPHLHLFVLACLLLSVVFLLSPAMSSMVLSRCPTLLWRLPTGPSRCLHFQQLESNLVSTCSSSSLDHLPYGDECLIQ